MSEQPYFYYPELAVNMGLAMYFVVFSHPMEYAQFLMEIGHTPIPGYPKRTIFGVRNTFKYLSHIRQQDGIWGWYRGLMSKIEAKVVCLAAEASVSYQLRSPEDASNEEVLDNRTRFLNFGKSLLKDIAQKSVGIVASQPFYVISWRVMGQFVGREHIYSGLFRSIYEIYRSEGVTGFFTGIIPQWLAKVIALVLANTINFTLNTFVITDPLLQRTSGGVVQYISYGLTNPFTVTAMCYGVNDCGLACGVPPNMPVFSGWTDCWRYLLQTGRLYYKKAGSSSRQGS